MGSLDNIFANSGDNPNIVNRKLDTTSNVKSGGNSLNDIFANAAPVNNNWKIDTPTTTEDKGLLQKAADVALPIVKKVAVKVGDWFNSFQKQSDEGSFLLRQTMGNMDKRQLLVNPQTGKEEYMTPALQSYYSAKTPEEKRKIIDEDAQTVPIMKVLNSPTGAKVTGAIASNTSNIPLKIWAGIKSLGDDTYDEAYNALLKKSKDPNNSSFEKIMYGVQDSGVQSAIGALLSVGVSLLTRNPTAGKVVGGTYFAAVSAESQRQEKGKVYSTGDIAIDTVGDSVIGGFAESALKSVAKEGAEKSVKNFLGQMGKGFVVEGTTEPAQTFLKYANDYKNASTEEDKQKIVEDVTNYVKNGGMVQEFLVGGISGGAMTGLATGAGYIGNNKVSAEVDTNLIKSRDTVLAMEKELSKDPNNANLAQKVATEKENLNDYQNTMKQRAVYISDDTQDNPLASVETVKYPDGKYSVSYSAEIPSNSVNADFLANELFKTKEEAVAAGKKSILEWVNSQESNLSPEDRVKLQEIKDNLNTQGISQAESIKRDLNNIIKDRTEKGNYNMIEGGAKGDSMKFSAWNRAISGDTTDTEKYNAKKYLSSAYVGKEVNIDGNKGEIISTPAFGKSKVQFEDGTTQNIEVSKLTTNPKSNEVNEYLKNNAIKEATKYIDTFGIKKGNNENITKNSDIINNYESNNQESTKSSTNDIQGEISEETKAKVDTIVSGIAQDFNINGERVIEEGIYKDISSLATKIDNQEQYNKLQDAIDILDKIEDIENKFNYSKKLTEYADKITNENGAELIKYYKMANLWGEGSFSEALSKMQNRKNKYGVRIPLPKGMSNYDGGELGSYLQEKYPNLNVEDAIDEMIDKLRQGKENIAYDKATIKDLNTQFNNLIKELGFSKKDVNQYIDPTNLIDPVENNNKSVIENKTQKQAEQNPVKNEGEIKKSKAFDRVRARLGDEYVNEDVNYNKLNLDKDTAKALEFMEKYPEEAKKIALGAMGAPEGITETAISIAVAEKALQDGDYGLQAAAERSRSLRQTRRGQEIVAERGRFNENSPHYFIQQVLSARADKAVKEGFRFLSKNKSPKAELLNEKIDSGVNTIKKAMKKKLSATQLAQQVIDDLTC